MWIIIKIAHYDKINSTMSKKTRNILIVIVAALVVGSCIFMFRISPLNIKKGNREMPDATSETEEITSEIIVEQKFKNMTEDVQELAVVFSRHYTLDERADMVIELLDGNNVLASTRINCDDIQGSHRTYVRPENVISGYVGKELILRVYTKSTAGTGLALMMSSNDRNSSFTFGNNVIKGTICFSITGKE